MDLNADGVLTREEYKKGRAKGIGGSCSLNRHGLPPRGDDAADSPTPAKGSKLGQCIAALALIGFVAFLVQGNLFSGPPPVVIQDEALRLKALDTLPRTAAHLLRTRLKTVLRGARGVSARNEAMLFGSSDSQALELGAQMVARVLLGSESHSGVLVLDAAKETELTSRVQAHLEQHRVMAVVIIHNCHLPPAEVVYQMDKFFDEEYGGIVSDGQLRQQAVVILTGAFGGHSKRSVREHAARRFRKPAFLAKLLHKIPFDRDAVIT